MVERNGNEGDVWWDRMEDSKRGGRGGRSKKAVQGRSGGKGGEEKILVGGGMGRTGD